MAALVTLAHNARGANVPPEFAIVADDSKFGYVVPGNDEIQAELDERVKTFMQMFPDTATALDWLRVGGSNMNYLRFTEPISADTYEAAVTMAEDLLVDETDTEQDT
jgi:hypothetical protein